MSSFPRNFFSKEEKPCNDVVERILSMLCPATMQGVVSALGTTNAFKKLLVDVENEAIQLLGTSDLLEKLESAFYRADDLLDGLPNGDPTKLSRNQVFTSYHLKKIARLISKIEGELVEKRGDEFRSSFYLKENPRNPNIVAVASKEFVARDKDREAILRLLLEGNEEIIPIVGAGGLGKTELVKVVFNDEQVQQRFKQRLWLSGFDSLEFDLQMLSYFLLGKEMPPRFLIVLDEVCSVDPPKFELLRGLLRSSTEGSRAIVTTQSEDVAKALESREEDREETAYRLKSLDEEASLALFQAVALKEEKRCPESLDEIVKMCRGNPFLIKSVASLMSLKRMGIEKQSFSQKEFLRMPQERVDAIRTIKSSYRRLPLHLKPCFAYCGLFPKNHNIDVQKLIQLWMAQGYVASSPEKCPEDVGYEYFTELFGRFFFEEVEKDEEGNISKCKISNILHDLARQVAGIELVALSLEEEEAIHRRARHVSFDFHLDSPWQISDLLFQAKRIRTIMLLSQLHWQIEGRSGTSICDVIVSNFLCLRSLDLHNSGLKVVSDSIGKLRHLRYLDLSQNTDIKALPDSICGLSHLQTLKLNFCGRLEELPRGIKRLVSLRTLELDSCYSLTHMPCGIGLLMKLRTLSEFVLRNDDAFVAKRSVKDQISELKALNNLRGELRIKNLSLETEANEAELHKKEHLQSLVLIYDMKIQSTSIIGELNPHQNLKEVSFFGYCAETFPDWLPSKTNLEKLSLWKCLKCKSLPQLNLLPRLKVLALEDLPDLEHISEETLCPSLQELRLVDLPRLQSWRANENEALSFPSLVELLVEDCPKLVSMPISTELQVLVLKNTIWSPLSSSVSLSKLKALRIVCSSIGDLDKQCPSLQSLEALTFDHLPYMKSLPSGLTGLTGLRELNVWRCNNLIDVSECVAGLESLKKLSFKLCLNLKLPLSTVSLLASRTELEILDCPRIDNVINRKIS